MKMRFLILFSLMSAVMATQNTEIALQMILRRSKSMIRFKLN